VVHLRGCSVSAVSCIKECDNVIWSSGGEKKAGTLGGIKSTLLLRIPGNILWLNSLPKHPTSGRFHEAANLINCDPIHLIA